MELFCVYIQEAHPTDGWQVLSNLREEVLYRQPTSEDERAEVAEACVVGMQLAMPTLLDDMSNETEAAYCALPERLYLVDASGRIAWRSGPGPFGFDLDAFEAAIRAHLGEAAA